MDPMREEANNTSVRVEIFNQPFNLRGNDPDYLLELAGYVDAKMRAVAEQTHTVENFRLTVLTALNIADEYHRLKTELDERFTEEVRQRNRERRQRHYTKRSHEKQLLAIVNDESVPAKERRKALFAIGRVRGYLRAPKNGRRA